VHTTRPPGAPQCGAGAGGPGLAPAGSGGAVVRDRVADGAVWREYVEGVVRERDGWKDFYRAAREVAA
ncbi:hypothetical protein ACFV4F_24620, partial [Kitasatospora sp. NPDC059722]